MASETCLVAMSGGVDSSAALHLLHQQGYECTGCMMLLTDGADPTDARAAAERAGIPFFAPDLRQEFRQSVITPFCEEYLAGRTPNPCIFCNRSMKFGTLLDLADVHGCRYLATGHYARISFDVGSGRRLLRKAADESKDQSYVLYTLTQAQLARVLFPLGGLTKADARAAAAEAGFANAQKKDSQDICFVPDGDYAAFLTRFTGRMLPEGDFLDEAGRVLGRHRGILHYTVGQRRGMGIAAEYPLYVVKIDPENNAVTLGKNESLFSKELTAHSVNLIAMDSVSGALRCTAKIRYRHREQPCTVWQTAPDTLRVEFDEPQRAITSGQSVVLYDGDTVLGGGIID